jgi:hypothetical protein
MKNLICALTIGLLAFAAPSYAHCGSCGVGDETHEAHAADSEKGICAKCGEEKGSEACAEACAASKGEKCSDCGAAKGSEECQKHFRRSSRVGPSDR